MSWSCRKTWLFLWKRIFTIMVIFVLLISDVVNVLVHSQVFIAKKKSAQTTSAIAVANSVWARSSTFKRTIIGRAFCCFTPGSLFAYPLKVCSNNNDNDPSGSLLRSSLKFFLMAWDRYPTVSLTIAATSLFFGPCKKLAYLIACAKANNMSLD